MPDSCLEVLGILYDLPNLGTMEGSRISMLWQSRVQAECQINRVWVKVVLAFGKDLAPYLRGNKDRKIYSQNTQTLGKNKISSQSAVPRRTTHARSKRSLLGIQ